ASSGGMFNNYAIVQGVDHLVPVDIYVPGCPPRPDMLIDAMFKLKKDIVAKRPMAANEIEALEAAERAALEAPATHELKGLLR
ncbi:MAG: NADH-quinone oxidoreductase subunit B, partial [Propionicimonas sp.]